MNRQNRQIFPFYEAHVKQEDVTTVKTVKAVNVPARPRGSLSMSIGSWGSCKQLALSKAVLHSTG